MKIRSLLKTQLLMVILILVVLVIVMVGAWRILLSNYFPHDDYREGITMAEAQSLVIFPICVPIYIPPGTIPNPEIIFDADDAKVPEVTYIRLRYKHTDSQKKAFEVYQRYTRNEELKVGDLQSQYGRAKATLLYWMVPYPELLFKSADSVMEEMQINGDAYQTDETVWWFYEIVEPSKYRSTMTEWIYNHVEYRILSYLSAEEIRKVTLSMLDCSGLNP